MFASRDWAFAGTAEGPSLRDKIFGCIAGSRMGSAFGAPVEGWSVDKIRAKYGVLDRFLPYGHYNKQWQRPPGTTEDGIERQKLMCLAIIEKQDRITVDDLAKKWVEILDVEMMEYVTEGFDRKLVEKARSGKVPAGLLGSEVPINLNTLARSFHAIPVINACDVDGVIRDVYDVGRAYQPLGSQAFPWGAAYNAGVVHAMRPDATVESVIGTVREYAGAEARKEIEHVLSIAAKHTDPLDMRAEVNAVYANETSPYCASRRMKSYRISSIMETVSRALAIFSVTKGNVKQGIIAAANFGRDADCLGATVGGLAGALRGSTTIPREWIELVDAATAKMPFTCSKLTLNETVDGMYGALRKKIGRMRGHVGLMESQLPAI
ncbi:MAG: ADP-ribosylglycohydrolase family protein [Planctomycetota bacterium]